MAPIVKIKVCPSLSYQPLESTTEQRPQSQNFLGRFLEGFFSQERMHIFRTSLEKHIWKILPGRYYERLHYRNFLGNIFGKIWENMLERSHLVLQKKAAY